VYVPFQMDKNDDVTECPFCPGRFYQRKPGHYKRHMKMMHNVEIEAGKPGRRACSVESTGRSSSQVDKNYDLEHNRKSYSIASHPTVELDSVMISTIGLCVRDILCHAEYDMKSLNELVVKNYKGIPDYVVPYVVRAAVESAWFASKNHHEVQCYQHTTDDADKDAYGKAKKRLLTWFTGLQPSTSKKINTPKEIQTPEESRPVLVYTPTKPAMVANLLTDKNPLYSPSLPVLEDNGVKEFLDSLVNTTFPVDKVVSNASLQQELPDQWTILSLGDSLPVVNSGNEQGKETECAFDPLVKRSYVKSKVVATKPKEKKSDSKTMSEKKTPDEDVKIISYTTEKESSGGPSDPRLNKKTENIQRGSEFNPVIAETVKLNKTRVSKVTNEQTEPSKDKKKRNSAVDEDLKSKAKQVEAIKKPRLVLTKLPGDTRAEQTPKIYPRKKKIDSDVEPSEDDEETITRKKVLQSIPVVTKKNSVDTVIVLSDHEEPKQKPEKSELIQLNAALKEVEEQMRKLEERRRSLISPMSSSTAESTSNGRTREELLSMPHFEELVRKDPKNPLYGRKDKVRQSPKVNYSFYRSPYQRRPQWSTQHSHSSSSIQHRYPSYRR